MLKLIKLLALAAFLFNVNACAPRGETKSLEEILKLSRERYLAQVQIPVREEVARSVEALTRGLDGLPQVSSKEVSARLSELSQVLVTLSARAGYTSKASFAELINQYDALAESSNVSTAQLKLLTARTYALAASELEGQRFAL